MAHMFATGEPVAPADPIVDELVREARDWLARPVAMSAGKLEALRYGAVDQLDNARDVIDREPAAALLLLGETVRHIIAYAFWRAGRFQPRRQVAIAALAELDPAAAALVRRWAAASASDGLAIVEVLARQVLGVDTFFAWSSEREPVAP